MSKTILVVDDSSAVRHVVKMALTDAGYNVLEGVDGRDGLAQMNGQKIHGIVSDVNMPNMDGITMVSEAKKIPAYKFTPVIMLTTESQKEIMARGKAAGVKAWMVKPFKPDQMLAALDKLIP